jgi:hypothetical protein
MRVLRSFPGRGVNGDGVGAWTRQLSLAVALQSPEQVRKFLDANDPRHQGSTEFVQDVARRKHLILAGTASDNGEGGARLRIAQRCASTLAGVESARLELRKFGGHLAATQGTCKPLGLSLGTHV